MDTLLNAIVTTCEVGCCARCPFPHMGSATSARLRQVRAFPLRWFARHAAVSSILKFRIKHSSAMLDSQVCKRQH
eukprot:1721776-Amphidinium_carterae.3